MKVSQFLKVMCVITFMAVLYIHLQVKIYALAYQGKDREIAIEKLSEHNVIVKNDILRLKSSDNIGRKLLAKEKEYRFAGRSHVVEAEDRGRSWDAQALNSGESGLGKVMTLAFTPAQPSLGR